MGVCLSMPTGWFATLDRLRCLFLLISIAGLMALYPYLTVEDDQADHAFTALFSAVMLLGLYSVARSRRQFWFTAALLLPAMLANWTNLEPVHPLLEGILSGFVVAFFLLLSVLVLRYVFSGQKNIPDRLCGALSVYLLMALAFAEIYAAIYVVAPHSFVVSGRPLTLDSTRFLYLSFVTQTTMGYGDMTPNTAVTESLAIIQATTGVLYVAVLVAWLVGSIRPLSNSSEDEAADS